MNERESEDLKRILEQRNAMMESMLNEARRVEEERQRNSKREQYRITHNDHDNDNDATGDDDIVVDSDGNNDMGSGDVVDGTNIPNDLTYTLL